MTEQPLNDRNAADDAVNEDIVTSWAMASHIADHLHHLMTISLQIMSTMKASQDEEEGDTQSQSSGASAAFSGCDEEAMKKRLESLPGSLRGSMLRSDTHETAPETQEEVVSITASTTYKIQEPWNDGQELEMQVMETSLRVSGQAHPSTLSSMANWASTYSNQGRWKNAEDLEV